VKISPTLLRPLLFVLPFFCANVVWAQCGISISGLNANVGSTAVNYVSLDGNWTPPFGSFQQALGIWGFGCSGEGSGAYPQLTEGVYDHTAGVVNFYVVYQSGYGPNGRCGVTNVYENANTCEITGGVITMYELAANGAHCADTEAQLLAHEIGHTLGLADVDYNAACNGTIMGSHPTYVSSDQCQTVNDNWYTPDEYADDHVNDDCNQVCRGTCDQGHCSEDHPSPILIDVDGHGYHLTDLAGGVHFDLDSDGRAEAISWTRDGSNAFLCLDRNKNGVIDNGRELFGNYTPLSTGGVAQNGYEALSEFDEPDLGGNADGWIDANDAIWPFLLLWKDENHDGISQPRELSSLGVAGIARIDIHYFTAQRRDSYGNRFRFRGRCLLYHSKGALHELMTYDVFFLRVSQ
jgi:hypothetical protein